jgi:uncharacterized protein
MSGKPMLFVIHATDKSDGMATRAKFYRAHRIHLDHAEKYDVDVVTTGTLLADDGETPVGSIFVIDARDRTAAKWRVGFLFLISKFCEQTPDRHCGLDIARNEPSREVGVSLSVSPTGV